MSGLDPFSIGDGGVGWRGFCVVETVFSLFFFRGGILLKSLAGAAKEHVDLTWYFGALFVLQNPFASIGLEFPDSAHERAETTLRTFVPGEEILLLSWGLHPI